MKIEKFEVLLGKVLIGINVDRDMEYINFTCSDGSRYKLYHEQDCCEDVRVESITGEVSDLINSPILMAEIIEEQQQENEWGDTSTFTFYKLSTIKGYVTIRWVGESNGYYSESVDFVKI